MVRFDSLLQYEALYDDYGLPNIIAYIKFIEIMDAEIKLMRELGKKTLVFCAAPGKRGLTSAEFILGTYMIIRLKLTVRAVFDSLKVLDTPWLEVDGDASIDEPKCTIRLLDYWTGIDRAKLLGWFKPPSFHAPFLWGLIDKEAYDHYDDPFNADLNEIVPRKIIAFRGPKDLPDNLDFCNKLQNGAFISRDFSPTYYAMIFKGLGVSTVVRLNRPEYDKLAFTEQGFEHFDLDFQGCSIPSPQIVTAFFKIIDEAQGLVAVHGREGLGRPATLIALYLMRMHRFGALEAIAWVRIMRPGSVLVEQQAYLVGIERSVQAAAHLSSGRFGQRTATVCSSPQPLGKVERNETS